MDLKESKEEDMGGFEGKRGIILSISKIKKGKIY